MKILTTPKGSKFWRIFDTSKCYLISEFNLTNPVLFDTLKIHQVRNTTNERRISISFRFKNKDAEIFDILLEDNLISVLFELISDIKYLFINEEFNNGVIKLYNV